MIRASGLDQTDDSQMADRRHHENQGIGGSRGTNGGEPSVWFEPLERRRASRPLRVPTPVFRKCLHARSDPDTPLGVCRMSLCKLCGREAPLVKAHIISESMYPFEEERREPLLMVPSAPNIPRGKSSVGEYDSTLVCAECEAAFAPWDDYAVRIFRKEPKAENYIYIDGKPRVYTLKTYDYPKLKLFLFSVVASNRIKQTIIRTSEHRR
jgi:hypothetical protein